MSNHLVGVAEICDIMGVSRQRVAQIIETYDESPPADRRPFTPRALNVLTNGLSEALKLGHNYVGTEHLLLSVIRDPEGVAFKILTEAGVTQDRLRKRVVEVLAGYRAKGSGDA